MATFKNWANIWADIWGDIWALEAGAGLNPGDEVMCVIDGQGGIECMVLINGGGTPVRVVNESVKKVFVLTTSPTTIKVTI
jgi:hypothetical protein